MKKKAIVTLIVTLVFGLTAVVVVAHNVAEAKKREVENVENGLKVAETIIITSQDTEENEAEEPKDVAEEPMPDWQREIEEEIRHSIEAEESRQTADAPVIEPETTEVDPEEILKISEAEARERGGYYVRRDGELYIVNTFCRDDGIAGGFGNRGTMVPLDTNYHIGTYYRERGTYHYLSIGDVPMATLMPGDELISFGRDQIGDFFKAELKGYTIPIITIRYGTAARHYLFVDFDEEPIMLADVYWDALEVCDSDGNIVEDYRNLPYGETYTVSWFEGTNYREFTLVSNCSYYNAPGYDKRITDDDAESYKLEAELHKESYASFDFSHIPAGLYEFSASGGPAFIRIVN